MKDIILQGDSLEILKTIPSESVDMVMTSPPYWALRDYGVEGQLGLESTFQEYINKLCDIFDEVKRVLKKEGTCWVNMGDTYASGGKGYVGVDPKNPNKTVPKIPHNRQRFDKRNYAENNEGKKSCFSDTRISGRGRTEELMSKCLCLIPHRFAIEMCNRGWILRNEIIWHKPNCMPSSVKDRFTVDFEKIFFFVKNKKYWFETQYEPFCENSDMEYRETLRCGRKYGVKRPYQDNQPLSYSNPLKKSAGRNKRSVWTITTKPFKEAHFATYPEKLCETPIKAGCPVGGVVLDPFFGAGTTGVMAKKLGRKYIGIELNPEYIKIAQNRINSLSK